MSNPRSKPIPQTSKPTTRSPPLKNPSASKKQPIRKPTPVRTPNKALPASKPGPGPSSTPKAGNWINRTVQNSVAGVGSYAGSFINGIGYSVNKVGEGVGNKIADTTRGWGHGVAGYGNNIKDSVGVGGPRVSTGGNPLGLAGMGSAKNSNLAKPSINSPAKKVTASNPLGI